MLGVRTTTGRAAGVWVKAAWPTCFPAALHTCLQVKKTTTTKKAAAPKVSGTVTNQKPCACCGAEAQAPHLLPWPFLFCLNPWGIPVTRPLLVFLQAAKPASAKKVICRCRCRSLEGASAAFD